MNNNSTSVPVKAERSLGWLYDQITGDEDARVCKDIPDAACRHQPRNFFAYLFANVLTKIADELSSARLVFPWLLGAMGAPAAFTGFLVPIREAGVLFPQLFVAAYIRRLAIRKTVWIIGAVLSALVLFLLAMTVNHFSGATAGWVVLGLITLFSVARGLCSVAAKDVVGKTVSKTRRGILMGIAASSAGAATMLIGLYLVFFAERGQDNSLFFWFLLFAGVLWLGAVVLYYLIRETPGATEGGGNAIRQAFASLVLLKTDERFRHFVVARTLLLSVALVLPFYVLLAQANSADIAGLGLLIIANGIAATVSSPFWGRLSDRSSRFVMVVAAVAGGVLCVLVWLLNYIAPWLMSLMWIHALLYFLVAVAYHGVRLGRKVYLVDMSSSENRASYVAVSNTVIGVMMLIGGIFGYIADLLDTAAVIGLLGLIALVAAVYIQQIEEVSG